MIQSVLNATTAVQSSPPVADTVDRKIPVGRTFKSLTAMGHEHCTFTFVLGWSNVMNGWTDSSILHVRRM